MNRTSLRPPLAWLLLALLPVLCYARMLGHGFVRWDDPGYITDNQMVRAGLSLHGALWALTTFSQSNWHPLTWLSHMLDCQLFGLRGGGHHLTGLLLHTANTLLCGLVLLRMTGSRWRSLLCAALFAIHPLHVESVAWASERKDLLSALFGFLALLAYADYARRGGAGRYLLVVLCFALSLCGKPMLVTLPLLLLVLDFWPLRRLAGPTVRQQLPLLLVEKLPLLVLTALSCAVTLVAQELGLAVQPLSNLALRDRALTAVSGYCFYLQKTVWPSDLAFFYPQQQGHPGWVPAALGLAALTGLCLWTWRSRPYLLAGWLWYLGTLVPVIGLVQVGEQAVADRYSYWPLCGVFIMIVWSLPEPPRCRRLLAVAVGITLLLLGAATGVQVGYWRDSYTLFLHGTQATQRNHLALTWLAAELIQRGQPAQALTLLDQAIAARSTYAPAYFFRGLVLLQGAGTAPPAARSAAVAAGLAAVQQGLILSPGHTLALAVLQQGLVRLGPAEAARDYAGLAVALAARREEPLMPVAIRLFERALELDPGLAQAHHDLGVTLAWLGEEGTAIVHFTEAVRLLPAAPGPRRTLAALLAQRGRGRTYPALPEGVRRVPDLALAYTALGLACEEQGAGAEAAGHYREALALAPDRAEALQGLRRVTGR